MEKKPGYISFSSKQGKIKIDKGVLESYWNPLSDCYREHMKLVRKAFPLIGGIEIIIHKEEID